MVDLKINGSGVDPSGHSVPGKPGGGALSAVPFAETLKQASVLQVDGELKEILSKVRALGDRFFKSPDEERLDDYKNGIKQFLQRVGKEMFSLRQETGSPKDGQQKVYQLVETVNSEIDSMTRQTLQQDKALKLLACLDDIRGLVIDLIT